MDVNVIMADREFLEGPRWQAGRIWVSDFFAGEVVSAAEDGSDVRIEAELDDWPSGTGLLPDGRLLVVSMQQHRILRREHDGRLVTHADLSGLARGPVNDMAVDPHGNAYVGCFGFDLRGGEDIATAPLIRVTPDGRAEIAADGLYFPNGIVADGQRVVVGETVGNRLSVFDVAADGSLGERRDWARFGEVPATVAYREAVAQAAVTPDGISQPDAEGAIWVADPEHNRAIRVADGGEILAEVPLGKREQAYAVALGGADGRTLFLVVAPGMGEFGFGDRAATVRTARVDVPLG